MKRRISFVLLAVAAVSLMGGSALAQSSVPGAVFFERWDGNHDNKVTLQEVRAGRGALFRAHDRDGDGVLSARELDLAMPQGNSARGGQDVLRSSLDPNGDGIVTKTEFVDGSSAWMARMDSDGNGVLTTSDFGRNAGGGAGRGTGRGAGAGRNNR